jgi:hypothetical protein
MGDPSFYFKQELVNENPYLSLLLGVKIPLFHEDFITSGTLDLGASFYFEYKIRSVFAFYSMAGLSYLMGDAPYDRELRKNSNLIMNFGSGIAVKINPSFVVIAQLTGQTSPYNTGIERIDSVSLLASFGLRTLLYDNLILQFNLDEDVFTFSSVDIAFQLKLEWLF